MNPYVQSLLGILLSAILTENFILVKFYGICCLLCGVFFPAGAL